MLKTSRIYRAHNVTRSIFIKGMVASSLGYGLLYFWVGLRYRKRAGAHTLIGLCQEKNLRRPIQFTVIIVNELN